MGVNKVNWEINLTEQGVKIIGERGELLVDNIRIIDYW